MTTNKRNLIVLANTAEQEDMNFYKGLLRPRSQLYRSAVVIIFSEVDQFYDFLLSMPPDYSFSLLIHLGKQAMTRGLDGEDYVNELEHLGLLPKLKYEFTSRDGKSKHQGLTVHHTNEIPAQDVSKLPLNTKSEVFDNASQSQVSGSPSQAAVLGAAARGGVFGSSSGPEIAILTALYKDEHEIFEHEMSIGKLPDEKNLKTAVFKDLQAFENKEEILLGWQDQMGVIDASAHTAKLITQFHPKYFILAGVCGGLQSGVKLYDVIIPGIINDYISGKLVDGQFQPSPLYANANEDLIGHLKDNEKLIKEYMLKLAAPLYRKILNGGFQIHFRDMACGPWVVKTEGLLSGLAEKVNANIKGLEMESLGVIRASNLFHKYGQYGLVVKSVMDYTDVHKNDGEYGEIKSTASYMSYLCVRALLPVLRTFSDPKMSH
jgi:nucleoside phosphorylase